jgi:hypothetical protein
LYWNVHSYFAIFTIIFFFFLAATTYPLLKMLLLLAGRWPRLAVLVGALAAASPGPFAAKKGFDLVHLKAGH